jgi:hypothetical protein
MLLPEEQALVVRLPRPKLFAACQVFNNAFLKIIVKATSGCCFAHEPVNKALKGC